MGRARVPGPGPCKVQVPCLFEYVLFSGFAPAAGPLPAGNWSTADFILGAFWRPRGHFLVVLGGLGSRLEIL